MDKRIMLKARQLSSTSPFHLPLSAQPIGNTVRLTVENAPAKPEVVLRNRCRDVTWCVQMSGNGSDFTAEIMLPIEPTIVYYHFKFSDMSVLRERRQIERTFNGPNSPIFNEYEEGDFQITVYDPSSMPSSWTQGMLIYQIFPDRFFRGKSDITLPKYDTYGQQTLVKEWNELPESPPRGRDFFGGDLRGIIDKLGYLKDLGVDCLYLCPIFDSPTNHRYDTNNYSQIAPMLGTEEDFIELIEQSHALNIKIILDAVYNHCSCDSIYFDMASRYNGAYKTKQSPYYRWFSFTKWPEEYQKWLGHQRYPEFVECPEVEEFFLGSDGITSHWLQHGLDGWRTDATRFNSDNFWRKFRSTVNSIRSDAYLVSEEWEDASHYIVGDMFSATMNYRFTWALQGFFASECISASQFEDRLATLRKDTPPLALLSQMNLISSHDIRRALTACNNELLCFKQMVAFQMSYPGAPMIYYGDEMEMTGENGESGRKPFPWNRGNKDVLDFYRNMIKLRQLFPAFRKGLFKTLVVDDESRVYGFTRSLQSHSVYAIFNSSRQFQNVSIPLETRDVGSWSNLLNRDANPEIANGELKIGLPSKGFILYVEEI